MRLLRKQWAIAGAAAALWLAMALFAPAGAEITVADETGRSTTGEVVRVTRSDLILQSSAQRISIKLKQLTEASRAEVVAYAKNKGVYAPVPPLRVQAQVATQQRPLGTSSYRKVMEIKPRAIIEGTTRMEPVPELQATMVIVTMDTRAKYTANKELFKVQSAETITVSPADSGQRRQIDFAASSVDYDSYRDKSNVGGAVYKYFIFGLRDPESKTIVEFQTNHPQLASLCKTNPQKREEFLALKDGARFPSDIR